MMGIVVPETCSAYKKYNKIISDINLVFLFFSYHNKIICTYDGGSPYVACTGLQSIFFSD